MVFYCYFLHLNFKIFLMDIKDLQNLIKFVSKVGVSEVKYRTKDFEINIKTQNSVENTSYVPPVFQHTAVVSQQTDHAPQSAESAISPKDDEGKYLTIKSPMIGTFYRRSSPTKEVFVNVGDTIAAGDTVCVIEAMKLFNNIESEVSGKIVKILVEDASPVEYDQPLFLVDPS